MVEGELRQRNHDVVAPDLPRDDAAGSQLDYADAIVDAIGDQRTWTVVAQSYGGFAALLLADRLPVEALPDVKAGAKWWMPELPPEAVSLDRVRGVLRDGRLAPP